MKTTYRSLAFALFLVLVLSVPVSLFAQSPFEGTWHTNMDQSKYHLSQSSFL